MLRKSQPDHWSVRVVRLLVYALVCPVLLAGCGTVKLDNSPPAGFDLSGVWLREGDGGDVMRGRGSDFRSGFLTQDFPLLIARNMRIEQDARSMGIEFARGSYRDVSWGERRRGIWEVQAGWHEGDLHIYSESSDTSAVEVYRLEANGQRLLIDIQVRSGGRTEKFTRIFTRQSGI